MKRQLWRLLRRARFLLFDRHRHRRLLSERFDGRELLVLPDVLNPILFRTGEILTRAMLADALPEGARTLDLGCGAGLTAVAAAARHRCAVVATDLNPAAVRAARINSVLWGVETLIDVRHGDLWEAVADEKFDRIWFNPPFYRGRPRDAYDRAWRSEDVPERFAAGLADHLCPGGSALVVLSTDGDGIDEAFAAAGLDMQIDREVNLRSEIVRVLRLSVHRG